MKAYKLFRILSDGSITPLFINKTLRIPIGEWLEAESHPTKGYKYRPFWHCTNKPEAKHLSEKDRVWYEVEIDDYEEMDRPSYQGGLWYLAKRIKVLEPCHTLYKARACEKNGDTRLAIQYYQQLELMNKVLELKT